MCKEFILWVQNIKAKAQSEMEMKNKLVGKTEESQKDRPTAGKGRGMNCDTLYQQEQEAEV